MSDFGLIKPFDIDNEELDGLRPQDCFVLGYELATIDFLLEHEKGGFERPIHAENQDRVRRFCGIAERQYLLSWVHDDPSETWMSLRVLPVATK